MTTIKDELLPKMSTQRLLQVLKKLRTSIIYRSRYAEDESDHKEVASMEAQQTKIKDILKNREHLERKK